MKLSNILWKYTIYLFPFIIPTFILAQNEVIVIDDPKNFVPIGKQVSFLEDRAGKLTFEDIQQEEYQQEFQKIESNIFIGPPSNSALWFRIVVENKLEEDIWLEIGDPYTSWYIDFYHPDYANPIQTGSFRSEESKVYPSNYFYVPLAKAGDSTQKICYVRVFSEVPSVYYFKAGGYQALSVHQKNRAIPLYLYLGLAISMLVYNLFLWLMIKNKIYLYYLAYLCYISFALPYFQGQPLIHTTWLSEYISIWTGLGFLTATLFAIQYLQLYRNARWLYYWLILLTVLLTVIFPFLFVNSLVEASILTLLINLFTFVYNFSLLLSGVVLLFKGQRNARFYVLGWSFVVFSMFTFTLASIGVIPYDEFTKKLIYFGFGMEMLLFSIALGDLYNTIRKEKEKIQEENLLLIKRQNEELEQKISERTKELQTASEEIASQNEEIKSINEGLETKINERTEQLEFQNKKFLEYAFHNAHLVRAPLARLMGLAMLLEIEKDKQKTAMYAELILKSAEELDVIIRKMNQILEEGNFLP